MTVLLRTIHGSRLYGLANPLTSDYDFYLVVSNGSKRATQKIQGKDDTVVMTLGEFARQVHKGVPQALEALFSPLADRAPLDAYRYEFYPSTTATVETYRRTMKSFALGGTVKSRRHALRLGYSLSQFLAYGQFCPTLDARTAARFTDLAEAHSDAYVDGLLALAPVDPFNGVEDFHRVLADSYATRRDA